MTDEPRRLEDIKEGYAEKYGFHDPENYVFKSRKGLNREIVEEISWMKGEPDWMREFRLRALEIFLQKPMPTWGADLSEIDFNDIYYYVKASERQRDWDEVPEDIKNTFDKLGIPEAEQRFLAGVGAQYESEVVYHNIRKDLESKGVIFLDMDSGLREQPDLVREYFGTVIPSSDNKFAALNSAVWSGGSFIYVPPGVRVEMPLQAYFRINTENMGQFERTLIIVDEGAFVHYVEGCLPPGEKVSLGHTWTPIESVRPGDVVMASDGCEALVESVRERPFTGDLVEIQPLSKGNAFRLTPEHPVLAVRRRDVIIKRKPRRNWLPGVDTRKLTAAQPEFIPAGELERGDFIVFPISKITRPNPRYTPEVMRLLGYYLAEGSAYIHNKLHQPVVAFSFGEHEQENIDEVAALVEAFTGKNAMLIHDASRSSVEVRVYSQELLDLCLADCGKLSHAKQLSKTVMELPADLQAHLLEAYFRGDGSVYKRKHTMVRASTASQALAWQLQELLARQGHYATISVRKGGSDTILGHEITRRDQYILYYSPDKQMSEVRRTDDYFLVPIKHITRTPYSGPVFNFELASEPNAYLARGFAVHNCTAPIYSSDSLHSAVVEIIIKRGGRCRYSTIQNWSNNVYNLVTKRSVAYADATMEWVDGNLGCLAEGSTVTTPSGIKTIESLEVGEKVLAYDETTGELCFRTVLGKRFSGYQPVHTVSAGERKLRVTANHPFYSYVYDPAMEHYRRAYVRADHLVEAIVPCLQTELATEPTGARGLSPSSQPSGVEIVPVEVSEPTAEAVPTWDIEVEGTGNFVSQGFIVHNSKVTMKYPAVYLMEPGAHGEVLSIAFAGEGQHQDAGAKMVHVAPHTTSKITSKSISKDGGRATYRGLLKVHQGAYDVRSNVVCDALLLDPESRSDTYPTIEINEDDVTVGHEATVSRVGEDQLFYLMSRGLSEEEANAMVVNGFIEPLVKELPMEYALELNRLIQLQMEGSVG
jgi:Fe-S cluster assembly protein SufB